MRGRIYTEDELELIKQMWPDCYTSDIAKALNSTYRSIVYIGYKLGLRKSKTHLAKNAIILKDHSGQHQFKKGITPHNKGKKVSHDVYEKMSKTMFKKGTLPHNTKSDNTITLRNDDGKLYYFIRISVSKWQPLHRYLYEKAYGPIPKGGVLRFIDKNTQNVSLDNLQLISRGENMVKNSIHRLPEEVKEVSKILKKLNKQINNANDEK
jgi:hypothetical protein